MWKWNRKSLKTGSPADGGLWRLVSRPLRVHANSARSHDLCTTFFRASVSRKTNIKRFADAFCFKRTPREDTDISCMCSWEESREDALLVSKCPLEASVVVVQRGSEGEICWTTFWSADITGNDQIHRRHVDVWSRRALSEDAQLLRIPSRTSICPHARSLFVLQLVDFKSRGVSGGRGDAAGVRCFLIGGQVDARRGGAEGEEGWGGGGGGGGGGGVRSCFTPAKKDCRPAERVLQRRQKAASQQEVKTETQTHLSSTSYFSL